MKYQFLIPYTVGGTTCKEAHLLEDLNGISEKIIKDKTPGKPYTWIARVLTATIESIGGTEVYNAVASKYHTKGVLKLEDIPEVVKKMAFADASNLLVESHRQLWADTLKEQSVTCMVCHKQFDADLELNRIDFREEDKQAAELLREAAKAGETGFSIVVDLVKGLTIDWIKVQGNESKSSLGEYAGAKITQLIYRPATLGDYLLREDLVEDEVQFDRAIAFDTCVGVTVKLPNGEEVKNAPMALITSMGNALYDMKLSRKDLAVISEKLFTTIPVMPLYYKDTCPCPKRLDIPITCNPASFFG